MHHVIIVQICSQCNFSEKVKVTFLKFAFNLLEFSIVCIKISKMKSVKKRKSRNYALNDLPSSSSTGYHSSVNPLIKDEIIQLVKIKGRKNRRSELKVWTNFQEPIDFERGVKLLASLLGIDMQNIF